MMTQIEDPLYDKTVLLMEQQFDLTRLRLLGMADSAETEEEEVLQRTLLDAYDRGFLNVSIDEGSYELLFQLSVPN